MVETCNILKLKASTHPFTLSSHKRGSYRSFFCECCVSKSAHHGPDSCFAPLIVPVILVEHQFSQMHLGSCRLFTLRVLPTVHLAWKGQFCLREVEENASRGEETTVDTNKSEVL